VPPRPSGDDDDDETTKAVGYQLKDLLTAQSSEHLVGMDLVVIEGRDLGARFALQPGVRRLGSAAGSDVRLTDPTVSRVHCELELQARSVKVSDQESTNGTSIDGVRVYVAELRPGSVLHVGSSTLRLERRDEPIVVPISPRESFGELLGKSVAMRRIYAVLERAAKTDVTVLVQGETGTGKDVVARSLHAASNRANGPFVAIDCGSIAENLIESELFGHVRGAFSGANGDRRGLFEEANGGTLFLDEVGELPIALQPKLLRVLETREVRRVGANVAKKVDVRVVAATNRPLARAVNEGTFREDLFYRLAVVEVHLPPLRARREDVGVLAQFFHDRITGKKRALPQELVRSLGEKGWPGNVRELRNYVERMVSLGWTNEEPPAPTTLEAPADLDALVPSDMPLKEARIVWNERFERIYLRALLARTGGNVRKAAEVAGVNRRWLQRLLAQYGRTSLAPGVIASGGDEDDDD
jgi:DNA-binding NtrC family response regulator